MPAAFLVSGVITRLAPFSAAPRGELVVLQALASLALLRALWVISLAARAPGAADLRVVHAVGGARFRVGGRPG